MGEAKTVKIKVSGIPKTIYTKKVHIENNIRALINKLLNDADIRKGITATLKEVFFPRRRVDIITQSQLNLRTFIFILGGRPFMFYRIFGNEINRYYKLLHTTPSYLEDVISLIDDINKTYKHITKIVDEELSKLYYIADYVRNYVFTMLGLSKDVSFKVISPSYIYLEQTRELLDTISSIYESFPYIKKSSRAYINTFVFELGMLWTLEQLNIGVETIKGKKYKGNEFTRDVEESLREMISDRIKTIKETYPNIEIDSEKLSLSFAAALESATKVYNIPSDKILSKLKFKYVDKNLVERFLR